MSLEIIIYHWSIKSLIWVIRIGNDKDFDALQFIKEIDSAPLYFGDIKPMDG